MDVDSNPALVADPVPAPTRPAAAPTSDDDGAATERGAARTRGLPSWAGFLADAFTGSYSQILFNRSPTVGLLLLLATMTEPIVGGFGVLAVVVALVTTRALQLSSGAIRAGLFSYNALLIGVTVGALYSPSVMMVGLLVIAAMLTVVATATFRSALGVTFNLPSLTLPFLLVAHLVLAVATTLPGIEAVLFRPAPLPLGDYLVEPVAYYLRALGALFFLPNACAGALVLAALLVYSRIGFLLSLIGLAVAYPLIDHIGTMASPAAHLALGYNLILVAIALGGVWFVPRGSAFLLALAGAAMAVLVTLGTVNLMVHLRLPALVLPFNLTVFLVLYAMRQRVRDGSPKAVDFAMGTPEQNLNYYETRLRRFGSPYGVRFSLPFLGRWVCTQSVDGEPTHQGEWRHAFDFEMVHKDGRTHRGSGNQARDYACYKLPVLAIAPGTVVKVVNDIPDNAVGEVNLGDNWGNLVIIYHSPGLYSALCHLHPGSVRVNEGDQVRRGDRVGLVGNSGRSPVPHLHFQLQSTARVGSPTIESGFSDVVRDHDGSDALAAYLVPARGEQVRNVKPDNATGQLLAFSLGQRFALRREDADAGDHETELIRVETDAYGNLMMRSDRRAATVYFETRDSVFTIYDYLGPRESGLCAIYTAIPRVPLEDNLELTWSDYLGARQFKPSLPGLLADFVAPFTNDRGLRMRYRMQRIDRRLVIEGISEGLGDGGEPLVKSQAIFEHGIGLTGVKQVVRGQRREYKRIEIGASVDNRRSERNDSRQN